ncbi:MAG: nitroreductase family protein [Actinomycetota bacterium]
MKTGKAIATLRAIRTFKRTPVEPKRLAKILEAGRRAPSSKNEQRWAFIVVREPDRLAALAGVGDYAGHLAKAPVAIAFVTPDSSIDWERESIAFDLGQCVQSMLLAAWEMGIGGCHAAVYDEAAARRILGLPDGMRCDYLISLGYPKTPVPTDRPTAKVDRHPVSALRHDETWTG